MDRESEKERDTGTNREREQVRRSLSEATLTRPRAMAVRPTGCRAAHPRDQIVDYPDTTRDGQS